MVRFVFRICRSQTCADGPNANSSKKNLGYSKHKKAKTSKLQALNQRPSSLPSCVLYPLNPKALNPNPQTLNPYTLPSQKSQGRLGRILKRLPVAILSLGNLRTSKHCSHRQNSTAPVRVKGLGFSAHNWEQAWRSPSVELGRPDTQEASDQRDKFRESELRSACP